MCGIVNEKTSDVWDWGTITNLAFGRMTSKASRELGHHLSRQMARDVRERHGGPRACSEKRSKIYSLLFSTSQHDLTYPGQIFHRWHVFKMS